MPPNYLPPAPVWCHQHPNQQPMALANVPVVPLYTPPALGAAPPLPAPQYPIILAQGNMNGLLCCFQFRDQPEFDAAVVQIDAAFNGLHTLFPHASFGAIANITPHTPAGVRKPPGPCSVVNSRIFQGYRQF